MTYIGLLRLLFARRHPIAKIFILWATETLFTARHGTKEAKISLAEKLLGVETSAVRTVLAASAESVSVMYLFSIGRIGDLRKSMGIDIAHKFPDDHLVAKYGYTTDLIDRMSDHRRDYGKFVGADVRLCLFSLIEADNLSKAESDIRTFFVSNEFAIKDNKAYKELVVVDGKLMDSVVRTKYKAICKAYQGRLIDLHQKIKDLHNELEKKDLIIARFKHVIIGKDKCIEILERYSPKLKSTTKS